jgi:glycosyltransferase involved in cell wall biosynthesis
MKIAIDIRAMNGHRSGVGHFVFNLVRGLTRIDAENEYLLYANRDVEVPFPLPANFARRVVPLPVSNAWLQTACPLDLARQRVDVFHGTNFVVPLVAATPRVATVYDLTPHLFPQYHTTANTLVQRLVPASVRACRRVIAVSEHTKNDLIALWNVPDAKIRVVPGAAGEEFFPRTDRAELDAFRARHGLPERFLLFVGTLEPRKNVTAIFDAIRLLKNDGINGYRLVVVGEKGWRYAPIFERLDALGMKDDVHFVGYQDWDALPYFYSLARLLVFPSFYEGFGLPPLEAMACGTPAVVGDNSSLREVVPDPALRADAADPRALAGAIAPLLTRDDIHREAARQGLLWARSFTWDAVARRTLAVYREAAAK